MSDLPIPTAGAKARVHALGEKGLLEFFSEVSTESLQPLVRFLPTVDGFRKTSPAGIEKQKQALAKRLVGKSAAQDRDYRALYVLWRTWIWDNMPSAEVISELVDKVEHDADAHGGVPSDESVKALFDALNKGSHEHKWSREQIERLLIFSPFSDSDTIRSVVATAKSATDIEREATLTELPRRLRRDEDEIQAIKTQLRELTDRLDSSATAVDDVGGTLTKLRAAIDEVRTVAEASGSTTREQAEAWATDRASILRAVEELRTQVDDRLASLSNDVTQLEDALTVTEEASSSDSKINPTRMEAMEGALAEARNAWAKETQGLSDALKTLTEKVATLSETSLRVHDLASLARRLEELERRPVHTQLPYETKAVLPTIDTPRQRRLRSEILSVATSEVPIDAASVADAVSSVTTTLEAVGLRKSAARILAEEFVAAIFSGQVVFLKGSMAIDVARSCANALGGNRGFRITLPLGLTDGEDLRDALQSCADSDSLSGVALEGVNGSAFDVVKEVLRDFADAREVAADTVRTPIAIFVTLLQGVAALPIELAYLEIGPVFDLDSLDWRTRKPSEPAFAATKITIAVDRAIRTKLRDNETDPEEPLRLARLFVRKRNPRIEHVTASAFGALTMLRSDPKLPSPLQSIAFGWLVPMWVTLGISKEQADSELDGGRCDAQAVDPRIAAQLQVDFESDARAEEI